MFRGSEPARPPSGRGGLGNRRLTDHLTATPVGVTAANDKPAPTRRGNYNYNARNRTTAQQEDRPRGRRHVDPCHMDLSEGAKRQQGNVGKGRVMANEDQMRAAAYYANPGKNAVAQPGGTDNNLYLKSYYYTPMEQQKKKHNGDLSISTNYQSTSVELAEARLRRIAKENPQFRDVADKALREDGGDPAIVAREQQISHHVAAAQYARGSNKRVAAIEATTKYHGRPDLGSPSPAIEKKVPYALNMSAPRPDTREGAQSGLRISRNHNKESSPEAPPAERPLDRHLYDGPKPYDTTDLSGPAYPVPPPVGVSCSIYEKPPLVRYDARHNATCREDRDTLALKRARAARESSLSQPRTINVVGGTPASPQSPPAMRSRTENNMGERRTGKAHVGPAHRDTRPW